MDAKGLRISEVARMAGVNPQTLRYYERRKLLPPARRTPSGYRQFRPEAVRVVRFIKRAQDLGFTLAEIVELLRLRAAPTRDRRKAREVATAKLHMVDEKIGRLQSIRGALAQLLGSCERAKATLHCPILEALEEVGDT